MNDDKDSACLRLVAWAGHFLRMAEAFHINPKENKKAEKGKGEKGTKTIPERWAHGCQMTKIDPFLSLDCARVEGVGAQSKERKGSNFAA